MEKGLSRDTQTILRFLSEDKKEEMLFFAHDSSQVEYTQLQSDEEVAELFSNLSSSFLSTLTPEEQEVLKYYTGTSYKEINACLRDNWDYETNGLLTPEKKQRYMYIANVMKGIIAKCPSLGTNLKVYRGTSLKQFRSYGIESLADLKAMEGNYFYDKSFTSTSLIRERSLLGVDNFFTGERNIEIEYMIPEVCADGALLLGEASSYYKGESEFLINANNLTKITSVEIDEANNKAYIKAVLIPKMLWDPPYMMTEDINKQNKIG